MKCNQMQSMLRLRTRLDRINKKVFWKVEGHHGEYERLVDLLNDEGLTFSHSTVCIKLLRDDKYIAKLVYDVVYNQSTDQIKLCNGLLGEFQGSVYDTFIEFGNAHVGFAAQYNAQAQFHKHYQATSIVDDDDSVDLASDSEAEVDAEGHGFY